MYQSLLNSYLPFKSPVLSEKYFISGEVPTTLTVTMEVDGSSPTRISMNSSHESDDNGSSRDVSDPNNVRDVAEMSRGDTDSHEQGATVAEILALLSISSW
jgi:hypothetical protein